MAHSQRQEKDFNAFLNRLTVYCGSTNFLDGYILAAIGPALVHLGPILNLNSFWTGAIGAGSLIGILVGGPIFGYVSDKVGRKLPFMVIPIAMAILSILSMFVTSAEQLFIVRFLLGLVIGSDYPSVTSYLAEYSPAHRRGFMIGCLMIMWICGMTLGEVVGYIVYDSAYNWQILLGITAVPAIILVYLRRNCPESPRWLMNKGRVEEATAIMKEIYGPDADVSSLEETTVKTSYTELFTPKYLKRIFFAGIFWATQVLPMFAIYIFGPSLLKAIKLSEGKDLLLGNSVIGLIFVIGVVLGTLIIEKFGRRPLIIWSFVGMAIGLLVFRHRRRAAVLAHRDGLYGLCAGIRSAECLGLGISQRIIPDGNSRSRRWHGDLHQSIRSDFRYFWITLLFGNVWHSNDDAYHGRYHCIWLSCLHPDGTGNTGTEFSRSQRSRTDWHGRKTESRRSIGSIPS